MRNERLSVGKKLMRTAMATAFIGSANVVPVEAKSLAADEIPATQIFRDLDMQLELRDNLIVDFSSVTTVLPELVKQPKPDAKASVTDWKLDEEISFYGPGFYDRRTACGLKLTKELLGVAHRSLSCGTLVSFGWKGKEVTVPVVDRGPYVSGRIFDLTGGACVKLDHCFTGPINYRIENN